LLELSLLAFDSTDPWFVSLWQNITTMSRYNSEFPFNVAFPPTSMENVLAEWLAKKGAKQCHIAETEKYAHVTFFFNGGVEKQFENEVRHMIPSPKVPTYDKMPEMSVQAVADKVAEVVKSDEFEFVMCNFARTSPPFFRPLSVWDDDGLTFDPLSCQLPIWSATPVSTMPPSRPSPLPTRLSRPSTTLARRPDTSSWSPLTTETVCPSFPPIPLPSFTCESES
jgi:hypothetical protein